MHCQWIQEWAKSHSWFTKARRYVT